MNLLEINASKTKVMSFSSKHLNTTSKPLKKVKLGHSELDYVDDFKYLGISVNTKLTFTTHLKNLINKVSLLHRIRKSLTDKVALQLYKTIILPVMDYGDLFYHHQNAKLVKKLLTIQNRCVRIIARLPTLTNTEEEEKKLNLLP